MIKRTLAGYAFAVGLAAPTVLQAQTTQSGPAVLPAEAASSEIIVTAQKRSESALTVPVSVTALSSETLINRGATSLADIQSYVPGLNVGTFIGGGIVVVRGLNTGSNLSSTTAVVVDGAPLGSSSSFLLGSGNPLDLNPYDLQRVEVLRGPQGTLYGASSLGGLVSYVTRRATLDHAGVEGGGEVASTKNGAISFTGRAALDLPVIEDKLGVRASGFFERKGGFIDNKLRGLPNFNQGDKYGGRLDVHFKPSQSIDIDVWGAIQKTDIFGEDFIVSNLRGQPRDGNLQYNEYIDPSRKQNYRVVHGQADIDLGFANLTYIGTYQRSRTSTVSNYSEGIFASVVRLINGGVFGPAVPPGPAIPNPGGATFTYNLQLDKNTHEVRLSSNSKSRFSWIAGGFFTFEKAGYGEPLDVYNTNGVAIAAANPTLEFDFKSSYREYSAFGNASYQITPKLTATGGLRFGRDEQRYQQFISGSDLGSINLILPLLLPGAFFPPVTPVARSSETTKNYLADLKYQFNPHAQTYFRFATGFRPGGPNLNGVAASSTFHSDSVNSYEIGFKGETADRKAGLELAGFYIDWSRIQVTAIVGGVATIVNATGAVSKGVEATARLAPVRGLNLSGIFAYTHTALNHDEPLVSGLRGNALPNTPRVTATVTVDYDWALSGSLRATAGGVIRLVSNRNTLFPNDPFNIRLDGYSSADVRLGVRSDKFELTAFIRNVTDERAALSGRNINGIPEVVALRPRTIGVLGTVRY